MQVARAINNCVDVCFIIVLVSTSVLFSFSHLPRIKNVALNLGVSVSVSLILTTKPPIIMFKLCGILSFDHLPCLALLNYATPSALLL